MRCLEGELVCLEVARVMECNVLKVKWYEVPWRRVGLPWRWVGLKLIDKPTTVFSLSRLRRKLINGRINNYKSDMLLISLKSF